MAGYNTILEVRRLEEQVNKLGFMFAHSRHNYNNEFGDVVALKPKDADSVPIYAEIFVGTLKDLQYWLKGVEWARQYDSMLKLSDEKKRTIKEDAERARRFSVKQKELLEELKKDHSNVEA
jgi:hypothetical protein